MQEELRISGNLGLKKRRCGRLLELPLPLERERESRDRLGEKFRCEMGRLLRNWNFV